MLDASAAIEIEATNPRVPELEAEAPGPHILEIATLEPVSEIRSQRPIGELEGWNKQIPELEGGRNYAVEL